MLQKPLISIIVPVYKVEKYIKNTIISIINQTFSDYEVILVDDGTPDNSVQIAVDLLRESGKNYTVNVQDNQGLGVARNTGFAAASGEWILFLDSDDVLQNFTLDLYAKVITENPRLDIVFSDFQYIRDGDLFKQAQINEEFEIFDANEIAYGYLLRKIVVLVPGTLYRSDFLKNNKITHANIRWSEDQHFMWQVLDCATKIGHVKSITYNYFRHPQTIMNSTPVSKMIDAYGSFVKLGDSMKNPTVKKYLVSRWVFGCCHEIAAQKNLCEWNTFIKSVNLKKHAICLLGFNDFKIRILALCGFLHNKLLYFIFRVKCKT